MVFHGLQGPAFSTALRVFFVACLASLAGRRVAADHVRAKSDRHAPIQMLMDRHRAPGKRAAKPALLQLPAAIRNRHRVVLSHHALDLHSEYPVQVRTRSATKCSSWLCRRYCELLVEYRNVALAQEGIRRFQSSDAGQPQLLRQPSLPGAETAFAAPACLRRIGRNHLHPQLLQSPAHLRQTMLVHLLARLQSHKEMAAAITI